MTEKQKNDPLDNTGESPGTPLITGSDTEESPKKQRKPKTAKQIEAARRNLERINAARKGRKQSKMPEESRATIKDDEQPQKPRKPKGKKTNETKEKKGWNWKYRFHF